MLHAEVSQREYEQRHARKTHVVPGRQLEATALRAGPAGARIKCHVDASYRPRAGRMMMKAPGSPTPRKITQFAYQICLWYTVRRGQKSMAMILRPLRAW